MTFTVYILFSASYHKHYTGFTNSTNQIISSGNLAIKHLKILAGITCVKSSALKGLQKENYGSRSII